jgi:hypothetical protein
MLSWGFHVMESSRARGLAIDPACLRGILCSYE